ncbi:hypothetical protein LZ536_11260 [Sphingomonas sp. SE158]|uniref:Uncharacterized protein n=1 Tax=Sphingomonas alba TaxID=2908208 RepID=A0ABT0RP95_9SPHN|nr:hypothetical protein [Sphingomonas alba]MCL6684471.1 hypothetical protein [Sphingomonas alba]
MFDAQTPLAEANETFLSHSLNDPVSVNRRHFERVGQLLLSERQIELSITDNTRLLEALMQFADQVRQMLAPFRGVRDRSTIREEWPVR